MEDRNLTQNDLLCFADYLCTEEKSAATQEKYLRDVRSFFAFTAGGSVNKERVMAWKRSLTERGYAVRSINSMLAAVNCFLDFWGRSDCKVKHIKTQQQTYRPAEKELTKSEYMRLLQASAQNERLNLVLKTICGTGIRVSELRCFTVEAVQKSEVRVDCKGKTRIVLIPRKLRALLLGYAKKHSIRSGAIFVTRNGKPLDRSNIWAAMKRLCRLANVAAEKVFPHNLRKLFARTFYALDKDIAKLADLLGHSSINTTRIYIMTTAREHRRKIERLGLVI